MPEIRFRDSAGVMWKKLIVSTLGNMQLTNSADAVVGSIFPMAAGTSTGTGSQQTIAHGMTGTPTHVIVSLTAAAGAVGDVPFMSAASDATNIYITAGSGKTYTWIALIKAT